MAYKYKNERYMLLLKNMTMLCVHSQTRVGHAYDTKVVSLTLNAMFNNDQCNSTCANKARPAGF